MSTVSRWSTMRRQVTRIGLVAGLLASLVGASPVSGGIPLPEATAAWAWMVVRDAAADVSRAPDRWSGNSTGATNSVNHITTGEYLLTFPGVQAASGNVLVSTLGPDPKICVAADWSNAGGSELVDVRCFTRTGSPTNGTFIVNWIAASGVGGRLAYGHNFSPTSNCGTPVEQYVSNGSTISTCPAADGVARWKIPGLGSERGTVQISALATRAIDVEITAGVCAAVRFSPRDNGDEWIDVKCWEPDGESQIYRAHDAWFMQGLGMKGVNRTAVAYVFANRPGAASYTPSAAFSYSSADGTNKVTREGVGRYEVKLPGMPRGGSAQVSAYIGTPTTALRHCVVSRIETASLPQRVGVRCFNKAGDLVDTKFTLAYAR